MKQLFSSYAITTGMAIFSMLFGAGNLMYPLVVGMESGQHIGIGLLGFFITAVCLPVAGLVGMFLFDGNYEQFFYRLGKIPGAFCIWACMMILGPLIGIPRITTVAHTMIASFIPWNFLREITPFSSFVFCIIFLSITFITTYRENKVIEILGSIISPALLVSLVFIIIKGLFGAQTMVTTQDTTFDIFTSHIFLGYQTLDLIAALFFASIVLNILKNTLGQKIAQNPRLLAWVGLKSGMIGTMLLGIIYIGMGFLGAYYSQGLEQANAGELFREISFKILGNHGAAIIAVAVLMACLSTAIALCAVVAEYAQFTIFKNQIGFTASLVLILMACIPLATVGLDKVLALTGGPITYIGYPIIITITLCNIAYKLFDFNPIKIPVVVTFILALASYLS